MVDLDDVELHVLCRAAAKEKDPNAKPSFKELGKLWAEVTPKEKAKFEKLATEAKAKYEKEKAARSE